MLTVKKHLGVDVVVNVEIKLMDVFYGTKSLKREIERVKRVNISKDTDLYITCSIYEICKYISYFDFKTEKSRICVYLHRYRFSDTRNQFKRHIS